MRCKRRQLVVVYLSFPTSNHNSIIFVLYHTALYIFRFLHQTTTGQHKQQVHIGLYIFRFLHQTTTINVYVIDTIGCISFVSYIKPQHLEQVPFSALVVYLSFPTSNHNCYVNTQHRHNVVYLSFPTSNHNTCAASVASS